MKIFKYIIMLFLIVVGTSCDKTDLYAYPSSDSNKTDITAFSLLNEKGENVVIESNRTTYSPGAAGRCAPRMKI